VTPRRWRDTSGRPRHRSLLRLLAVVILAACGSNGAGTPKSTESVVAPPPSVQPASPEGGQLLRSLRAGGFVIYFRHAATVPGGDTDLQDLNNCAAQRNLSDLGREQARIIGEAFRRLEIPVGKVLSSGLCRARDTATIAFGRAEQSVDITSLPQAADEAEEQRRIMALRQLLATAPPPGENTVLVAHLFNIQRAAETNLAEGEAAIYEPRDADQFALVATVSPDEWDGLASAP
jgi:phosphohistidine phosphatase SixA